MTLEEQGVRFTLADLESFLSGMREARGAVDDMDEAAENASGGADVLGDALSIVGDIAKVGLAAGLAVGTAAIGALAAGLALVVPGALENEQTLARLESQLKATGGRAGLTMQDLTDLGGAFQDLAGGTDDTVLAIESVGLRFASITKDVMPDFIQASLDMAAVMGTDATSAAQMLGMALEDPVGALGRLRRSGVIFTDAEEKLIKKLVAAGDAAGAQKVIMDKLAGTVGGAAAAQAATLAGKWEILKGRMGEAAETVGMALLPALTELFDTVIAPAIPVIEKIAGAFGELIADVFSGKPMAGILGFSDAIAGIFGNDAGAAVGSTLVNITRGIQGFVATIQANLPAAQEILSQIGTVIQQVFGWLQANWPTIQGALEGIGIALLALGGGGAVVAIIAAVGAAIAALNLPLLLIVGAAALLGAAWANNWGGIRDVLTQVWEGTLKPALETLYAWLQVNLPIALTTLSNFWTNTLKPAITAVWAWVTGTLFPMLRTLWDWLATNVPIALQTLADFWTNVLQPAITAVWNWITGTLLPTINELWVWLSTTLTVALQKLSDFWTTVLLPAVQAVWNWMSTVAFPFWQSVANLLTAVVGKAVEVLAALWANVLQPALKGVSDFLVTQFTPAFVAIADFYNKNLKPQIDLVASALSIGMKAALEIVSNFINSTALPVLRTLADVVGGQLKAAFDGVALAIQAVTDIFNAMATAISNYQLPDWLQHNSPSPFELTFIGADAAIRDLALSAVPLLRNALSGAASAIAPVAVAASALPVPAYGGGAGSVDNSRTVSIGSIAYNNVARPPSPVTDTQLAMALL